MHKVQEQLDFQIETPSDIELHKRFRNEALRRKFEAEMDDGHPESYEYGCPTLTKNQRKRQRKAWKKAKCHG